MRIFIFLISVMVAQLGAAQNIVLNNKTQYPNGKAKIAIQWAANTEAMQVENKAIIYGRPLDKHALLMLRQTGNIRIQLPKEAEYFRILVWSTDPVKPNLLTHWVSVVENKLYHLNQNQLVSAALVSGMGC